MDYIVPKTDFLVPSHQNKLTKPTDPPPPPFQQNMMSNTDYIKERLQFLTNAVAFERRVIIKATSKRVSVSHRDIDPNVKQLIETTMRELRAMGCFLTNQTIEYRNLYIEINDNQATVTINSS